MDENLRQAREFERIRNLTPDERLKYQFIQYLTAFNQSDELIKIAKKINWQKIYALIQLEFENLWNKFQIPRNIEKIEFSKHLFSLMIIENINHKLFYLIFNLLKEDLINKINKIEELNKKLEKILPVIINELFGTFNVQFSLSSLNENNNPKIIIRKIEELNKKTIQGEKFIGKRNRPYEIEVFKMVIDKYLQEKEQNLNPSFRKIAINVARLNLGLIHPKEQHNFYKRCSTYHKKQK